MFCLPTPLKGQAPDMSYIISAFNKIFDYLKKNQTIILESTVYPGATNDIFLKKLNKKFSVGKNFFLGNSPERIDPGKARDIKYENITKLVSGHSKICVKKISNFYRSIFKKIYICETMKIAETAKLFENAFRAVNIGLVNEMKMLTNQLKINMHDVVEAASSKPFGFRKFGPGPGVGGHCVPIDPMFISWIAKKNKFETKFINLSSSINKKVTIWTLNNIIKSFPKKKIIKCLVVGIAYKKDINDVRGSPALYIFSKLKSKKNIYPDYYDPYVKCVKINNQIIKSVKTKNLFFNNYDCVILLTDHSNINYKKILSEAKLIIDTRSVYRNQKIRKVIHL